MRPARVQVNFREKRFFRKRKTNLNLDIVNMNGRSTRMSILSILRINKDHSNPYFPTFLSYHDSGIGLTPYEKKSKGVQHLHGKNADTYPSG